LAPREPHPASGCINHMIVFWRWMRSASARELLEFTLIRNLERRVFVS
jgi:hypothetical protein